MIQHKCNSIFQHVNVIKIFQPETNYNTKFTKTVFSYKITSYISTLQRTKAANKFLKMYKT